MKRKLGGGESDETERYLLPPRSSSSKIHKEENKRSRVEELSRREESTRKERKKRRERRRVAGTHSCSDSCYRVIEWRPPDCTRYALPSRWNHLAQSVLFYPWEFAGPLYIYIHAVSGRSRADTTRRYTSGPLSHGCEWWVHSCRSGTKEDRVSAGVHTVTR